MANEKQSSKSYTKKHLARKQREARQTRTILIITIVIAIAVVGLVAYGLIDNYIVRPNHPVAQVGDQVIKADELDGRVKYSRVQMLEQAYQYYQYYQIYGDMGSTFLSYAQSIGNQLLQSNAETLGSQVLDDMINEIIIKEEAAARGITVSDEEVTAAMQEAFGFYPDGTPTPANTAVVEATPTYSQEMLAIVEPSSTPTATSEPTDVSEESDGTTTPSEDVVATEETEVAEEPTATATEASADSTDEAATPEASPTITLTPTITPTPTTYTTEIYGQNLTDFNDLYGDYNYSIDKLRDVYKTNLLSEKLQEEITKDIEPIEEQVWARHILVATEEEAQVVLALLDAGEDWNVLAAEYSTDEGNANNGGDLGWFNANAMVEPFSDAAFSLEEPGQISEPVQTDFGWHIIQLVGKREVPMTETTLQQEKASVFSDWLTEIRNAREDIEIFDDWAKYVPTTPALNTTLMNALGIYE